MKKNNSNSMVTGLLYEFGVNTEDELAKKLYEMGGFVNCVDCGKEVAISEIQFVNGDPVCWNHKIRNRR